jgi:curved DNA-binding protein CbpA
MVAIALRYGMIWMTMSDDSRKPQDYDLYAKYGLARDADPKAIEARRRALLKKWHPDKAGGNKRKYPEYEEKSKQINAEFDVLLDPVEKQKHDEELEARERAEAAARKRQAKYQRRAKQATGNRSRHKEYEDAFSSTGRSGGGSGGSPRSHQPPPPSEPPRPQSEPPSASQSPALPSFGTMVALLFWAAIALTVYKGCGALIQAGHDRSVDENGPSGRLTSHPPANQQSLVTRRRLGPIRLGMSRYAVESVLGLPNDTDVWNRNVFSREGSIVRHTRIPYQRLIYQVGPRQTHVFICEKTGRVSTIWSNESRYRSSDGFGFGSLEEDFRYTYPNQFGELLGNGYYDRKYDYLRYPAPPGLDGRCHSTASYTWMSFGMFDYQAERIDAIAVGWPEVPPLTKLGKDSYTPTERAQSGELSP